MKYHSFRTNTLAIRDSTIFPVEITNLGTTSASYLILLAPFGEAM